MSMAEDFEREEREKRRKAMAPLELSWRDKVYRARLTPAIFVSFRDIDPTDPVAIPKKLALLFGTTPNEFMDADIFELNEITSFLEREMTSRLALIQKK